jgi:hypothetical protein
MARPEIADIIRENARRNGTLSDDGFHPVTGQGSVGERFRLVLPDFPIPEQWLPLSMRDVPLVRAMARAGTLEAFIRESLGAKPDPAAIDAVCDRFYRLRARHDFPFWAATAVYIKDKEPGRPDCLFRLNAPQRRYVAGLEAMRLAGEPIRVCMLKARQWGGSTCTQIYMAWLQLVLRPNLNSLIIAHVSSASAKIKAMYRKMLDAYPLVLLHDPGDAYPANEKKLVWEGGSDTTQRVPQRGCTISVGSSESPASSRGGDYSLIHISEIGLFTDSEKIHPADLIRAATSGVLYRPLTMIVYESTADGIGTFFHGEYTAAAAGQSQFRPFFVPWFAIANCRLPFASDAERERFAESLLAARDREDMPSEREEPGRYLFWLWTQGATLEGIHWYVSERTKYAAHAQMAAEFPSNDIEAFANAGHAVFDPMLVERLRPACRPPRSTGDVTGLAAEGKQALKGLRYDADGTGLLAVWDHPETGGDDFVANRYLAVVDVGGRGHTADWSVVAVFDRVLMLDEGGKPALVAQWYGHCDIDRLAWKAAQIAAYYDNALLVIESNTLETRDRSREVDGDQSQYVLNQIAGVYPNLYARKAAPDDIRRGSPTKWGFHTNVATKPMIISNLVKCVRDGLYTERDARCLAEYQVYERKPNGSFGAAAGSHDDLLMTRAIGLHVCFNEMPDPVIGKRGSRKALYGQEPVSAATIG